MKGVGKGVNRYEGGGGGGGERGGQKWRRG